MAVARAVMLLLVLTVCVQARPWYIQEVPNLPPGVRGLGHVNTGGGGTLNPFGQVRLASCMFCGEL